MKILKLLLRNGGEYKNLLLIHLTAAVALFFGMLHSLFNGLGVRRSLRIHNRTDFVAVNNVCLLVEEFHTVVIRLQVRDIVLHSCFYYRVLVALNTLSRSMLFIL